MSRIALSGGAYTARSLASACQRCLNLFAEPIPPAQGEQPGSTYYPTPGLTTLGVAPSAATVRCLYAANNGDLYAVAGASVYYVSPLWAFTQVGTIAAGTTPVSMMDNGATAVLVDGTAAGYTIDLKTRAFAPIVDDAFYGADRVDYLDTFLLFNKPGTPQFYSTNSNQVAPFNPLYFANKSGFADNLATLIVAQRQIWLIGEATTEIWYDAGAADYPFQIMPGPFVEHGCAAVHSVSKQDAVPFWLSKDLYGTAIAVRGEGYQVKRISTYALEAEWQTYPTVADAIGFNYQQGGHAFYVLIFPTADKTWVYDAGLDLWHERCWLDANGNEHRHRMNCFAFAYGQCVVGDWENGTLYALDPDAYTDAGQPIKRLRSFPHMLNDGKRVIYTQFIADIEVGTSPDSTADWDQDRTAAGDNTGVIVLDGSGLPLGFDIPPIGNPPPQIGLRWSDTRGVSWGSSVGQSMGATGEYLTSVQWRRLGVARSRVFELEWSAPAKTALLGAYVETQTAGT